ncbi:hypothetical protein LWI29_027333 [Acer saccharum]|uniref:Uncharacterized protein n=1 Tax=Acer saccharum TaxID=4024 RepID=A0AA39SCY7_ACESA|nr:hypothetical protein LWI29_027333 [Acer saccharum]
MIAQGIPFESPRFVEGAGPSARVPVLDRLRPPLPIQNHLEDLRHRSVKPAMNILPRRIQSTIRPIVERRSSQHEAEVSIRSKRESKAKSVMQQVQASHTISGGPTLAETSNNSKKNHARKIPKHATGRDEFRMSKRSRECPHSAWIVFTENDTYNTIQPHDYPMVITTQIANCRVHRILIDTGSSVDILFKETLEKLNLKNPCYHSCRTPLYGFARDSVMPVGAHTLPLIIGEAPLQQNIMMEFIVVDTPSAYNAILGRPFLSGIRGVMSVYHNILKFPVGTERYTHVAQELSHRAPEPDHHILEEREIPGLIPEETEEEERGWTGGHPTEKLEEIQIRRGDPTKLVKIGGALDSEVRRNLVELLKEYNDIFAWNHDEMPGIPLNLVVHRLAVDATVKPVKQKQRHFNTERNGTLRYKKR